MRSVVDALHDCDKVEVQDRRMRLAGIETYMKVFDLISSMSQQLRNSWSRKGRLTGKYNYLMAWPQDRRAHSVKRDIPVVPFGVGRPDPITHKTAFLAVTLRLGQIRTQSRPIDSRIGNSVVCLQLIAAF